MQSTEPNTTQTDLKTMVFADHGNVLMLERREPGWTPKRLMDLAKARGNIIDAFVFGDVRLAEPRPWEYAGFHVISCIRYERERIEKDRIPSKESIDVTLIERIHREYEKGALEHIILIVGDSDYVKVAQSMIAKGVRVTILLTQACEFSNRELRPTLEEVVMLWEDKNLPANQSVLTALHHVLGAADSHTQYPLTARAKKKLDQLALSLIRCPHCKQQTALGLWLTHNCHPSEQSIDTIEKSHIDELILPSEDDIKRIAALVEGFGFSEFMRWYDSMNDRRIPKNVLRLIFGEIRTIRKTVLDFSIIVHMFRSAQGTLSADAADRISLHGAGEHALQYLVEHAHITVEAGEGKEKSYTMEERSLAKFAALTEFLDPWISHTYLYRNYAGQTCPHPDKLWEEFKQLPTDEQWDTLQAQARSLKQHKTPEELYQALDEAPLDQFIVWLLLKDDAIRQPHEIEAFKRIQERDSTDAKAAWIEFLGNISNVHLMQDMLIHPYTGEPKNAMKFMNLMAMRLGEHMVMQAPGLLLRSGVLEITRKVAHLSACYELKRPFPLMSFPGEASIEAHA